MVDMSRFTEFGAGAQIRERYSTGDTVRNAVAAAGGSFGGLSTGDGAEYVDGEGGDA